MSGSEKIFIVHDLAPDILKASIEALIKITNINKIQTLNKTEFLKLTENNSFSHECSIITLHLDLNEEIKNHEKISRHAELLKINQLNSYTKVTELFDNKYSFYKLMLANDIKQIKTKLIEKNTNPEKALQRIAEFMKEYKSSKYILKPNHGTESKDQFFIEHETFTRKLELEEELKSYLKKVLSYDSIILQNFLNNSNTEKILYYKGQFINQNKHHEEILSEFLEALKALKIISQIFLVLI